jgi:hypothetical protein
MTGKSINYWRDFVHQGMLKHKELT